MFLYEKTAILIGIMRHIESRMHKSINQRVLLLGRYSIIGWKPSIGWKSFDLQNICVNMYAANKHCGILLTNQNLIALFMLIFLF